MNDRRQDIFATAMESPTLTAREKVLMVLVVSLKTEFVDGQLRHGSRSMRPDGKFGFHLDYLAAAMFTTETNAKKIRQACRDKGHLSLVSEGSFGRPSTWQALVVKGDVKYGVTKIRHVPPYGPEDPPSRGDVTSPLTYRTPAQPGHAPGSGASPSASFTEERHDEERVVESFPRHTSGAACEEHGCGDCPDHRCTEDGRRTA